MSDDWKRWLDDKEMHMLQCSHLLPPPGQEVVEQWAKRLSETREKLAIARGALYSVKFEEDFSEEELDRVLKDTAGV